MEDSHSAIFYYWGLTLRKAEMTQSHILFSFSFEKRKWRGRWPSNRKRMSKIQMLINCLHWKKTNNQTKKNQNQPQPTNLKKETFGTAVYEYFFGRRSFTVSSLWEQFRLANQRWWKRGWPRWEEGIVLSSWSDFHLFFSVIQVFS